mgnify:CR=1 FL=1|jgi:hypothetical protein
MFQSKSMQKLKSEIKIMLNKEDLLISRDVYETDRENEDFER